MIVITIYRKEEGNCCLSRNLQNTSYIAIGGVWLSTSDSYIADTQGTSCHTGCVWQSDDAPSPDYSPLPHIPCQVMQVVMFMMVMVMVKFMVMVTPLLLIIAPCLTSPSCQVMQIAIARGRLFHLTQCQWHPLTLKGISACHAGKSCVIFFVLSKLKHPTDSVAELYLNGALVSPLFSTVRISFLIWSFRLVGAIQFNSSISMTQFLSPFDPITISKFWKSCKGKFFQILILPSQLLAAGQPAGSTL